MVAAEFEIVEAEWPDRIPATSKAVNDFLASGKKSAEIKGEKSFLVNIRRYVKVNKKIGEKVEVRMQDNRLFIRLREDEATE